MGWGEVEWSERVWWSGVEWIEWGGVEWIGWGGVDRVE